MKWLKVFPGFVANVPTGISPWPFSYRHEWNQSAVPSKWSWRTWWLRTFFKKTPIILRGKLHDVLAPVLFNTMHFNTHLQMNNWKQIFSPYFSLNSFFILQSRNIYVMYIKCTFSISISTLLLIFIRYRLISYLLIKGFLNPDMLMDGCTYLLVCLFVCFT